MALRRALSFLKLEEVQKKESVKKMEPLQTTL